MRIVSLPTTWFTFASTSLVGGIGFDRLMTVLFVWLMVGLHLDGWAHIHRAGLETFFTPWHAVLYSGFFAISMTLVAVPILNRLRGAPWWNAMPTGYGAALVGVPLFLLGGAGDMLWHIVFGVENGTEALLSPTHLLLALSVVLFFTGPVRAAYSRAHATDRQTGWTYALPLLVTLGLLLALFAFFTQYASPFATLWPGGTPPQRWFANMHPAAADELTEMALGLGIASVLVHTALLMSVLLFTVRVWTLPFGSITLVIGLSSLLMAAMQGQTLGIEPVVMFGVGMAAGLIADLLLAGLRPAPSGPMAFRLFAFSVPFALYSVYFAVLALTIGMWWSIHVWAGAIVVSGLVGVLISYLLVPPSNHVVRSFQPSEGYGDHER